MAAMEPSQLELRPLAASPHSRASSTESYQSHLAAYLCQEVFTDMSVLPLVFPDNMSCFSRGSFKEELARKRQLPVPPLPKKGGVIARSEDNVSGLSSRGGSLTPPGSLASHSLSSASPVPGLGPRAASDTRLHALGWSGRRRGGLARGGAEGGAGGGGGGGVEGGAAHVGSRADGPPGPAGRPSGEPTGGRGAEATPEPGPETPEEEPVAEDGSCEVTCETEEEEAPARERDPWGSQLSVKMDTFRKEDRKASLFTRAIERLSFRSSKRRKEKRLALDTHQPLEIVEGEKEKAPPTKDAKITKKAPEEAAAAPEESLTSAVVESRRETPGPAPPVRAAPLAPPVSATFGQSRPISQLDSALRQFRRTTAESRENLATSRPDLSVAAVRAAAAARPPLALPRAAPPRAASSAWRQKAPPSNRYLEGQWAQLSASMVDLSRSRQSLCSAGGTSLDRPETEEREETGNPRLGGLSLGGGVGLAGGVGLGGVGLGGSCLGGAGVLAGRTQSMEVLDSGAERQVEVPENQLGRLLPYQRRIQASMERLAVPSWYTASTTAASTTDGTSPPTAPATPKWRTSGTSTSTSTPGSWRRHLSSAPPSAPSTLARGATPYSSHRLRALSARCPSSSSLASAASSSASPQPPTVPLTPAKLPYLGWRSQERLDIGPAYLASPARRLASTALRRPAGQARSATLPSGSAMSPPSPSTTAGIREVTSAILSYCSPPGRPREAWPEEKRAQDGEAAEDSDHSGDSGIDRSDDFCHESSLSAEAR